jgi:hypothetical protein
MKQQIVVTFDLEADDDFPPAPDETEIATYLAARMEPMMRHERVWVLTNPTVYLKSPVRVIVDFSGGVFNGAVSTVPTEVMVIDTDDEENPRAYVPGFGEEVGQGRVSWAGVEDAKVDIKLVNDAFDKIVWVADWQQEVASGATQLGFEEWAHYKQKDKEVPSGDGSLRRWADTAQDVPGPRSVDAKLDDAKAAYAAASAAKNAAWAVYAALMGAKVSQDADAKVAWVSYVADRGAYLADLEAARTRASTKAEVCATPAAAPLHDTYVAAKGAAHATYVVAWDAAIAARDAALNAAWGSYVTARDAYLTDPVAPQPGGAKGA